MLLYNTVVDYPCVLYCHLYSRAESWCSQRFLATLGTFGEHLNSCIRHSNHTTTLTQWSTNGTSHCVVDELTWMIYQMRCSSISPIQRPTAAWCCPPDTMNRFHKERVSQYEGHERHRALSATLESRRIIVILVILCEIFSIKKRRAEWLKTGIHV